MAVVLLCNGYFVMKNNIKCAEKFVSNSNGEEVEVECIVLYSDRTDENKLKVEAYPMLGKNYSGRVLLNSYSSKETAGEMKIPLPGEHILVRGKFQIPKPATNPRCFHYRNYLMGKRVFMTGLCGNFKVIGSEGGLIWDLKRYTEKIRKEFFKDNLSHDPAIGGLIRGVVLGDKSNLDEETYDRFRLYGTAHILAVSGLHIGILVTIYRRAYRAHPSMFLTVVLVFALFFYGQVTRWSPSVFRAVTMSLIFVGAQFLKRDFDLLTALGISGIFAVGTNPGILLSLGFQMSYLAILGIGIGGSRLARWIEMFLQGKFAYLLGQEPIRKLSGWLGMFFGVQIVLTPFILQEFNYFTPFGIFMNLPIGILTGGIVSLGMLSMGFMTLGLGNIFPQVEKFMDVSLMCLGKILLRLHSLYLNGITGKNINIWLQRISPGAAFTTVIILLVMLALSETFYIICSRRKLISIVVSLCIVVMLGGVSYFVDRTEFDKASIVMVDVGQGDCLHVRSKGGSNMVFDGGGSKDKNLGKLVLLPYFLRNGVGKLDMACVTHRDTDHAKGLYDLRDIYKISCFVDGAYSGNLAEGEGMRVNVLWPVDDSRGASGEDNELSSVYRIDVDGVSVLVTGDIGIETEKELIKRYGNSEILKVDVLKVAHHGSRHSTSEEFLKAVNPKVAVIGVGKNNYGHPAGSIIDILDKNDIMTYRTDKNGAIGIWKENGSLKVCTMLEK